jgi:5-methylcytosine-specific restriction protein A
MRYCAQPGCPSLVSRGGRCPTHARIVADTPRDNAEIRRQYQTPRWRAARRQVLNEEPLCRSCQARGVTMPANELDHIQPHRLRPDLFWERTNLQALCTPCHTRKTRAGD